MSSKTRARIALLAGACVAGAVLIAIGARPREPEIKAGTAVLGVREEGIRTITFRTGAMTLMARRAGAGPFAVEVTYGDNRARQRCRPSQDLAGLLPDLGEIDARRQLTPRQLANEFPLEVGTMALEDDVDEPIPPFKVRMTKDRAAVALVYSGVAIEANMAPDTFNRLAKGCAGLDDAPAAPAP